MKKIRPIDKKSFINFLKRLIIEQYTNFLFC